MQFQVIMVTDPPTHKQTGTITIHCVAASAQCKLHSSVSMSEFNLLTYLV